ncbi:MAG TPA: MlaD family protein, partial [Verrucomicrobiae bacterium]|nr:MlaD family protein [Verrucomicrobiae bacterium]
ITDFGTRHTGYRVGVHFQSAAGLTSGALVYFSGVNVGSVESIELLNDNTVDVILAIRNDIDIPVASRFLIQAPLTGSPNLVIVPPRSTTPGPLLARTVLPVDQQPQGQNGATISDLLDAGQGEVKKLDRMLSLMEARTPKLLDTLQTTLDNANSLTLTAKNTMLQLSATMQSSLSTASANIAQLTGTLNSSATIDSKKIGALLDQFALTSSALNKSMDSLEEVATNPQLKANLIATAQNIATTTQTIAELTEDLRQVTGDPQTQAQMRNTIANLNAVMQRANSLLGELGGTSSVYGVDAGATPYPLPAMPAGSPYPFGTSAPLAASAPVAASAPIQPIPAASPAGLSPQAKAKLTGKLDQIASNLVQIQLRLYGLSAQQACCLNPTLPSNKGPAGDMNLVILPKYSTSFLVGASSVGNNTTYNAALLERMGNDAQFGGGVLYSQLGITGNVGMHSLFGVQGYAYNLRYPSLDLYGNLRIAPGASLFFGQRDMLHASRRNTYGLQYQF